MPVWGSLLPRLKEERMKSKLALIGISLAPEEGRCTDWLMLGEDWTGQSVWLGDGEIGPFEGIADLMPRWWRLISRSVTR